MFAKLSGGKTAVSLSVSVFIAGLSNSFIVLSQDKYLFIQEIINSYKLNGNKQELTTGMIIIVFWS